MINEFFKNVSRILTREADEVTLRCSIRQKLPITYYITTYLYYLITIYIT